MGICSSNNKSKIHPNNPHSIEINSQTKNEQKIPQQQSNTDAKAIKTEKSENTIKTPKDNASQKKTKSVYSELVPPVDLDTLKLGNAETIKYTLNATIGETETNILVRKNTQVTITVNSKGKEWSFLPELGQCTYQGYEKKKFLDKNIGSLYIRILSSAKDYIIDKDTTVITPEITGKIVFFPFLEKNELSLYAPTGKLSLTIKGGIQVTDQQLKQYAYTPIKANKLNTPIEIDIINYINKARVNPRLFLKDYVSSSSMRYDSFELLDVMMRFTPVKELQVDTSLFNAARDHCTDICNTGTTGHTGSNNSTVKDRIEKYNKKIVYFGENCGFGSTNPLHIVINMLIDNHLKDKLNMNNILNGNFDYIGVSLQKHFSFKYACVIVFGSSEE